jgi:glycosyltransferase involved in cell wall biosynthesis
MKLLLLIPHILVDERHEAVRKGDRPQTDYDALAEAVRALPGGAADILDLRSVEQQRDWFVRLVRWFCGVNWALAALGYRRCHLYDAVFTHSDSIGLPFALLTSSLLRRPRHVTIAHYLAGRRKAIWYRLLRASWGMDKIFTLSRENYDIGRGPLQIAENKLVHLEACGFVDNSFFSSAAGQVADELQICSVGLEFRDYGTLIKAVSALPQIKLKIDPSSPWSVHRNEVCDLNKPPNVELCHMELGAVRQLYAESIVVVVPLHLNSIGAGTTTLVEAMSMGKACIVTRSKDGIFAGRRDIIDGENVIMVDPADPSALRGAIERLVTDNVLRRRIEANAFRWAQEHGGRQQWLHIVLEALGETRSELGRVSRCDARIKIST